MDGKLKSFVSLPHGPVLIAVDAKPFMSRAGGQFKRECPCAKPKVATTANASFAHPILTLRSMAIYKQVQIRVTKTSGLKTYQYAHPTCISNTRTSDLHQQTCLRASHQRFRFEAK